MNLIGKMLNNRYEVLEKIGNGGMATVYKAKCHVLNRYVAIKILRDEFTTDSEFIKKFNTEAQSAASLTHPNIVSIFDVGNEDNLYYIVMELIQGKTLKDIIIEDGILSWKWSVNIAIQIASALETAHKHNIIHRDIKPHNIIITEDGMAKVTDFGIAKAVSNSTITAFGTTIGSVHYFSPEHARGGFTDAKSDIYSLGIVMYEMLTGKVPFDADTPVSVALKQVQEEPVEPIKFNSNIPIGVNRIILKAMQKDPNIRYQNATEMLQDLSMALKKPNEDFVVLAHKHANSPTQKVPTIYEIEMEKNNDRKAPKLGENDKVEQSKFEQFKKYLEEHPLLKVLLMFALCVVIFLVVTFGTLAIFNGTRPKQEIMPNLAGYNDSARVSKENAIALLEELGFKDYEVKEEYNDEVEEGYVISQTPEYKANYNINVTEKVTIVVSKGQKLVTLPKKMIGEEFTDISKELDKLEINYEEIQENSEEVEAGIILSVEPEEGEEIAASTLVKITVSKGSAYADVTMKNLIGMPEAEAVAWLTEQKITPEVVYEENATKSDGVVTDQSVSSGKVVKEASTVTITVNRQPKKSTVTVNVNLKTLTGYVPKTVSTNVVDETGNTVVKTEEVTPDKVKLTIKVGEDVIYDQEQYQSATGITQTFSTTGVKEVKILVNGVVKKNETVDFSKGDATVNAQ